MDRKAIASETLRIVEQGWYEYNEQQIEIAEAQQHSLAGSLLIPPEESLTLHCFEAGSPKIEVENCATADVKDLLDGCCRAHKSLTMEDLERIVRENNKQRHRFNDDHTKIRANQGHSVQVDVELQEEAPPDTLYHGTAIRFVESIRTMGITPQSRQYIHLSAEIATAKNVGSRHGKPAVLVVDAAAMAQDGYPFFRSENGVWLCRKVAWQYVREIFYP